MPRGIGLRVGGELMVNNAPGPNEYTTPVCTLM